MHSPRSQWKTRYFLDTEFTSFEASQLISLAIVGEDGREFYAEVSDFERTLCSDFVCKTVLPQLGQFPEREMPLVELRGELLAWLAEIPIKPKPILCYDYAGDVVLLEHLLGKRLPRGWRTENICSRLNIERLTTYFAQYGGEHHALHDARANASAFI
ncbi:hypothetical protein WM29_08620 [Burkholderia ubonensis]|nr:hypothetical protein WM29_08620 [Burkholderia ubonensis]